MNLQIICNFISEVTGVTTENIKGNSRLRKIQDARQALCLIGREYGFDTGELADFLRISRQAISHCCNKSDYYVRDFVQQVRDKIENYTNNELFVDCIAESQLPTYATEMSAGADLYSAEDGIVPAGGRMAFNTGFRIALPPNHFAFVKSRSGLMFKHGILTDGTIDADYRGEIRVVLFNTSNEDYKVSKGERIAQLCVMRYVQVHFNQVCQLEETERGEGGFGHTGK